MNFILIVRYESLVFRKSIFKILQITDSDGFYLLMTGAQNRNLGIIGFEHHLF